MTETPDHSGRSTPAIINPDPTLYAQYEASPAELDPVIAWDHEGYALVANTDLGYLVRADSYTTFAALVRARPWSPPPVDVPSLPGRTTA